MQWPISRGTSTPSGDMVQSIETTVPRFSLIDSRLCATRVSGISYESEDFGSKAVDRLDLLRTPANGNHPCPGFEARLDARTAKATRSADDDDHLSIKGLCTQSEIPSAITHWERLTENPNGRQPGGGFEASLIPVRRTTAEWPRPAWRVFSWGP